MSHKPRITIIVACARDFAIGRNGDLLFHLKEDLKHFKALTMGRPIVMGRKTFESFPNGALPGRRNIVITRNNDYSAPGIETALSLEDALSLCRDDEHVFIIGGGEIYRQALPLAYDIELTLIDATVDDADTYFPTLDSATWPLPDNVMFDCQDQTSGIAFTFLHLQRL